ncbi:MAG: ribosome-associated translation inhibitor RaiA [Patescibacteria group bacterium]
MLTITLKATNMELTPAIRSYAEEKTGMLQKMLTGEDECHAYVEVGQVTKHHQSGPIFRAEIALTTPQGSLRAEAEKEDLYAAIDIVKDELMEELRKRKSKRTTLIKKGGRMFKDIIQKMAWWE